MRQQQRLIRRELNRDLTIAHAHPYGTALTLDHPNLLASDHDQLRRASASAPIPISPTAEPTANCTDEPPPTEVGGGSSCLVLEAFSLTHISPTESTCLDSKGLNWPYTAHLDRPRPHKT